MRLTDTHTHIYGAEFDADRDEVFARAAAAGVEKFIFPAIDSDYHELLFEACRRYTGCYPLMGLHPTSVNDNPRWREELAQVEAYLKNPPVGRFYGIGEVGLDFYWSAGSKKEQTECFVRQVELSLEYRLPLVIHTRNAWPEMTEVLGRYMGCGLRGIMHAFGESMEMCEKIDRLGDFFYGIGGVVTYKKSVLAATAAEMPLDKMVLETDSPYLTPVPFRGKRNESGYLCYICGKVAELKGIPPEEVAETTTRNALKLFGIDD